MRNFDIRKFAAVRDENNPAVRGVYHISGITVATDGRILCAVNASYDESNEGKIIGKNGVIDAAFPKWRAVLLNDTMELYDVSLKRDPFEILAGLSTKIKEAKKAKESGAVASVMCNDKKLYIEGSLFLKFAGFLKKYPDVKIVAQIVAQHRDKWHAGIIQAADEKGNICVVACNDIDCESFEC